MDLDIALYVANTCLLIYLVWRLIRIVRIKRLDTRFFYGFWFTPMLWFLLENTVPMWAVSDWLFQTSRILLLLVFLADVFYYFGLQTTKALRHQVLSGLLLIPCLFVSARHYLPADVLLLTPPYYGKALIWTDRISNPRTFYFMDPNSTPGGQDREGVDPNYGKAAFSPLDGDVIHVEDGFLSLRLQQTVVRIGPLLPNSIRLRSGDVVRRNQPLGLAAASGPVPGISLTVEGDRQVRFAQTFVGRWWAGRYEQAVLKRNHIVLADAKDRFQLVPIDQ